MMKDLNILNIYFLTSSLLCSLSWRELNSLVNRLYDSLEERNTIESKIFCSCTLTEGLLTAHMVCLWISLCGPGCSAFLIQNKSRTIQSINFLNSCSKKPTLQLHHSFAFMTDSAPLMVWLLFSGNFSGWSLLILVNFFPYFFKNFYLISIQKSILPNLLLQILSKLWN